MQKGSAAMDEWHTLLTKWLEKLEHDVRAAERKVRTARQSRKVHQVLQAEAALASARERLQHFQWSYEGQ